MTRKWFAGLLVLAVIVSLAIPVSAQESSVKGNISVLAVDSSGASVPDAKITLNGPTGSRVATTDDQGTYQFSYIVPGIYTVKIEKEGFKAASISGIEVLTDRVASVRAILETGSATETVEVTGSAISVDTTTTAFGANLNDNFYEKIPIQRNVASLFYLAPGVVSGGASGNANPSISGASGLENQYIADGVDITDSAFGGLGIFSRVYGSLGTGINLTFIKEVQIKTGGFEPQYGKSTGGIVQIVTKSGSNQFHGGVSGFFQPSSFEATRTNPDDPQFGVVNVTGKLVHNATYDASAELGGYVPKFRDKLFFYAAINPTYNTQEGAYPKGSPLFGTQDPILRTYVYSYAAKLTFKINDNHQIESSVFGDPSHTNTAPFVRLTTYNTTANSKLNFGNRDWSMRYNGTLSPTLLVNISGAWGQNHFNEGGFPPLHEIIDQVGPNLGLSSRPQFFAQGRGFVETTEDNTYKLNGDISKTVHAGGEHTFSIGYGWEKAGYKGGRQYSGGVVPIPGANEDGTPLAISSGVAGAPANSAWYLRVPLNADGTVNTGCTSCPLSAVPNAPDLSAAGIPAGFVPVYLRLFRSEFNVNSAGLKNFTTSSVYHSAYVNDSWTPNKHVTLSLGVRWDQEHLVGQDSKYTFTDNWSPRLGIAIDPIGDRKNKIYANFARYNYNLPLDLAERSLTNEQDLFSFRLAPAFTVNTAGQRIANIDPATGSVIVNFDAAHVLNGAAGGTGSLAIASSSEGNLEAIAKGTRLMYEDEWVVGFEHEFKYGVVFSAKYVRRDLKRIVEDTGGISPEASDAGISQIFLIGNVNARTDLFTNPVPTEFVAATDAMGNITNLPTGCDAGTAVFPVVNSLNQPVTTTNGDNAVCFAAATNANAGVNVPDGIPDGFVNPIRRYQAVEFEVNKSFSKNWQLRANYRIGRLFGNFEGALRNDNGQTDPGISSLFDFTQGDFNLLGNQFTPGVLNTDRLHVANGYFTYVLDHTKARGLVLGTGIKVATGTPINRLAAHPVYLNAGEVPIGGRGAEGRTPTTGTVDFHSEYPIRITEKAQLHIGADLFNIGFAKRVQYVNQDIDLGFGVPNADFLKPTNQNGVFSNDAFQSPFVARLFARFTF
jgi:Carboxypeptidase regulatory-like domain/TonB-dependent Receptor Plug Domain